MHTSDHSHIATEMSTSPRCAQRARAPAGDDVKAEDPSKTIKSTKEKNQIAAKRRVDAQSSRSRRIHQQELMNRAFDLAKADQASSISISITFYDNGAPRSLSITNTAKVVQNSRPPGLHPRTPAHKPSHSSGCQVNAWQEQSYIAPHAHAAGVAVTPRDGAGVVHCANDLTCAFVHPPAASVAQDASGARPSNMLSSPDHSQMVNKVMEVAGVDASVAVSALERVGGDANAASDYLLDMRQESDAHQSAQRVQTGIEEAVTIDKNGDGSDTPPHPVGARAPAHRRTQGPSSMEKEHDTHSSRKPKGRKGKRPDG